MANEQMVDEVVSDRAVEQLANYKKELYECADAVAALADKSRQVEISLQNSKAIADLSQNTKAASVATVELTNKTAQYEVVQKRVTAASSEAKKEIAANARAIRDMSDIIAASGGKETTAVKQLRAEIEALTARNQQLSASMTTVSAKVEQSVISIRGLESMITRMFIRFALWQTAFAALGVAVDYFKEQIQDAIKGVTEYEKSIKKAIDASDELAKRRDLFKRDIQDNTGSAIDPERIPEIDREIKILQARQETGKNALRDKKESMEIDRQIFNLQKEKLNLEIEQDKYAKLSAESYNTHGGALADAAKKRVIGDLENEIKDKQAELKALEFRFAKEQKDKYDPYKTPKDPAKTELQGEITLDKALGDLRKQRELQEAQKNKDIFQDEQQFLSDRLLAYQAYQKNIIAANDASRDAALDVNSDKFKYTKSRYDKSKSAPEKAALIEELKGYHVQRLAIIEDFQTKEDKIYTDGDKQIKQIISSSAAYQIKTIHENLDKEKEAVKRGENDKLIILNEAYDKGGMSAKEYADKRKDIEQKAQDAIYKVEYDYLNKLLSDLKKNGNAPAQVVEAVEKMFENLKPPAANKNDNDNLWGLSDTQLRKGNEWVSILDKATETAITLKDIRNQAAEQEINNLQKQIDMVNIKEQEELASIQSTVAGQNAKEYAIIQAAAKAQQEREQLQAKQRAEKRKEAQADKVGSIAQIIENAGAAELNAMKLGPVAGPIFAGLIAALAIAQIGKVSSTPLPAYAKGTKSAKGGPSIVGELGTELRIDPSGRLSLTPDHATVMDVPAGSQIIPNEETMKILHSFLSPSEIKAIGGGKNNSGLELAFARHTKQVINAIENKKETHFHWDNGQLRQSVNNGGNWTIYINNSNN